MSGFNTIIGFLFLFFVVAGIVGYSMLAMGQTIADNVDVIHTNENMIKESQVFFALGSSYDSSGRLKLLLVNDGSSGVVFKDGDNQNCFDIYLNGRYISKDDFGNYIGSPLGNYYYLGAGDVAIMDVLFDIDDSKDNSVKIVTCGGKVFEYVIESDLYNWMDVDYKRRAFFTVFNPSASNLRDNYFVIELNESNFDFSKAGDDEVVFFVDLYENMVLDLTFDDYKQILDDESRYDNVVYLGSGSGVSVEDPSLVEGVFFDALSFDGGDFVRILADQSLELEKGMSISAWVRHNGSGVNVQNLFTNGNDLNALKIVNDGGVNDGRIRFDLNIGGLRTLYSDVSVDDGEWHHVVATFDGFDMVVFVDGEDAGSLSVAGDVTTYSVDNYIGRDMGGGSLFNGFIDDFKIYNFALNESEVGLLFVNNYFFKELNHTIDFWDKVDKEANVSVRVPFIGDNNENITIELYYYKYGDSYGNDEVVVPPAGNPSAINDLSGSIGNKEVALSWSAPNDNGNAITSYTIEYGTVASGLFDNSFVDDATPGATITGLSNDVEYQFRVFATNSEGDGSNSNVVNVTPTGRFYFVVDTTTNLGVDGSANQGTTPITYAQLQYGAPSSDASASIGERTTMTNYIMAQEYTPTYSSQTEIAAAATASIYVTGQQTGYTWRATMYEYNDVTGNVGGALGTASAVTTIDPQTLGLTFNNAAFNVSAGNRVKVVFDATNGGNRQVDLYYGTGTQSYIQLDVQ